MKSKLQPKLKGLYALRTISIIGILFALYKLTYYLNWTYQLVTNWSLPEIPFFSKVSLANSNVEISTTVYLIFALAYSIVFCFIIVGLFHLIKASKLLLNNQIFEEEISDAFNKAGKAFLIFGFGTFIIDFFFLLYALTSNRLNDLLSTELILFSILGYLMLFLSSIFKEGNVIKKENDLTI